MTLLARLRAAWAAFRSPAPPQAEVNRARSATVDRLAFAGAIENELLFDAVGTPVFVSACDTEAAR